jgi:hypothetical protein
MDDIKPSDEWSIDLDDRSNPTKMFITLPIADWASKGLQGEVLFHGVMEVARAIGIRNINAIMNKKAQSGLFKPGGNGRGGLSIA